MDNTALDLGAIEARCEALDERMSDMSELAWTLEGPNHYGLFSVYDADGNVVSHGIKERQDFVAHARRDIPALVAEVERLRELMKGGKMDEAHGEDALAGCYWRDGHHSCAIAKVEQLLVKVERLQAGLGS